MGGDGGSIPRRIELVRNKKKKESASKVAINAAKWKHCAVSQEPLRQPIVSCHLGRLYNKEAIIEKLLDESKFPNSAADHIRKLKDVRVLKLTNTPKELQSHELSSGLIENSAETFCCPVMGQEMNGSYPFVYSWECGCVVSKRAFDAVNDSNCLNCGKPFFPNSIILLNPEDDDDIKNAEERLKAYKEGAKMDEPGKKRKRTDADKLSESASVSKTSRHSKPIGLDCDSTSKGPSGDSKRPDAAHTASVQDDPNASAVFKSLFTTSEEAKNQPKGHWVTYNPLYFR